MGLFSNKKKDEVTEKKTENKTVEVASGEKSMKELYGGEEKTTSAKKEETKEVKSVKKVTGSAYRVLIRPLITEKSTGLSSLNKYAFEISLKANKIEVAKAISEVYGINPTNVNVIKMKGKIVRRGRYNGRRKDWKKAIVTLPKGKTIQVYEGI